MAGLLDYAKEFYAGGEPYRKGVIGLLSGDTDNVTTQLKQLFDPAYMKQVKPISMDEAINLAMMAMTTQGGKFAEELNRLHPNVNASLHDYKAGHTVLSNINVPKEFRGNGYASGFMDDLTKLADRDKTTLALSPSSDFGSSKSRLIDFYKKYGFVPNKGKNIDFTISESMIRKANK